MPHRWWIDNRKLYREERSVLSRIHPLLAINVMPQGFQVNPAFKLDRECAVVHGTYCLRVPYSKYATDYRIALILPGKYPAEPPAMFCNDPKLPLNEIDRHIPSDGQACLGVHAEIRKHWPNGSNISVFIEKLVAPFLAWQTYFNAFEKAPPWGQRSHGVDGIFEFYSEILNRTIYRGLFDFIKLLARKTSPKGHEMCPCGSGKKLRDCHRELVYEVRRKLDWKDVEKDLGVIQDNFNSLQ